MSPSYSREILPFPLRPHENADNPALCLISKNLYYRGRFQKSTFLVLEITVYVWTEDYNGEKKSSFSKISASRFSQVTETCESAKFVHRELYKF